MRVSTACTPAGKPWQATTCSRKPAGCRPARPGQHFGARQRPAHRRADLHRHPLHCGSARSPLTGGLRRVGGGRLLGAGAEVGRVRGHRRHGPRRAARSTCGSRTAQAEMRAAEHLWGQDPERGPGDHPRGAGRPARPRAADRPGRREPGALRLRHQRAAPLQRAHRHGRGDGLEEPQGDRGARARAIQSLATTRSALRRWAAARQKRQETTAEL